MTPTETIAILRQFNEWRRGDEDIPQFDLPHYAHRLLQVYREVAGNH